MSKPAGERFRLTIRSRASEAPAHVRLRGLLKRLLRSWQFMCEQVEELADPGEPWIVPAGTSCYVQRQGSGGWRSYSTKVDLILGQPEVADGDQLTFHYQGWLLRVARGHVVHGQGATHA